MPEELYFFVGNKRYKCIYSKTKDEYHLYSDSKLTKTISSEVFLECTLRELESIITNNHQ